MSALEQGSVGSERRNGRRFRLSKTVAVVIGRGDGVLIDLSTHGARIRHSSPVRRGAIMRLSFEWDRARFFANAEILASRVVSLGTSASYESRVRFTEVDARSQAVLARMLEEIVDRDVRRWVANLRGWNDDSQLDTAPLPTGSYMRCRLNGAWWEKKCTNDVTQPVDGFLLPSETSQPEIDTLCDTYRQSDAIGRDMIRAMAAAVVEDSRAARTRELSLVRPR
jgi:hypothetical protein